MRLKDAPSLFQQLLALPKATIRMDGDNHCRDVYNDFTSRHPRYRIVQNKQWGVALLPLPGSFEDYLTGNPRKLLRYNRRRAEKCGLRLELFDPLVHLGEILEINLSKPVRQGKPMVAEYLDRDALHDFFQRTGPVYGIFNSNNTLRAYAYTPVIGEVFLLARLLGHAEDLDDGIMYLLVSEIIREMIAKRAKTTLPLWGMYDTYFGAGPSLRFFKGKLGFAPYKVRWTWLGK